MCTGRRQTKTHSNQKHMQIHTPSVTPLGYFLFGGVNEPSKPKQIITPQKSNNNGGGHQPNQDKA